MFMAIKISCNWSCFNEKGRFFSTRIVSGFSGAVTVGEVIDAPGFGDAKEDNPDDVDDVVAVTIIDVDAGAVVVGVEGEKGKLVPMLVPKLAPPKLPPKLPT